MAMGRNAFQTRQEQAGADRFGLWLFLSALAILFVAALLGMLAIRLEATNWPDDLPSLPLMLWLSTGVLVASGFTMQWAVRASSRNQRSPLCIALVMTLALAIVFLIMQAIAWQQWIGSIGDVSMQDESHRLAGTGLLVLIGLHGAHIIGGLIPIATVLWLVMVRGTAATMLNSTAIYWHFIEVIWFMLLVFMLFVL